MKHIQIAPASAVLCWSTAFAFNAAALAAGLSSTAIIAGRMLIAAVGFLALFRARLIRFEAIPLRLWPRLLLTAALGLIVYHFALVYGQRFVSAGAAATVVMTSPVWATAISVLFGAERLSVARVVGLAMATAGAAVVLGGGGLAGTVPPLHAAIVLIAAPISLAMFTVLAKPLLAHGSANVTAQLTIVATIPLAVVAAFDPNATGALATSSIAGLAAIVGLGLVSTLLGYTLWFRGVDAVIAAGGTAAQTTAYQYLLPVCGGVFAWLTLGQPLGWRFAAGAALSIAGAYLVVSRRGRRSIRGSALYRKLEEGPRRSRVVS